MTDDDLKAMIDNPERRSEVSALALTEVFFRRIREYQPLINAFITTTPELAHAGARSVDEARARGTRLPLDGMQVAVKDNIDVAGVRATVGSKFFANRIPGEDAEVVRRLRAAGAVIVGKTLLHEFAYGGTSNNPFYGACRNPWDLERVPGGSSGGSAAALAADLAIGALGSDTGGSVRTPAHMNGVSSLRPTFGGVSNRGLFPTGWSFDTVGPLARAASDLARMFAVIAGYDPADPRAVDHSIDDPLAGLDHGVAGLRIGLPTNFFFDDLDSEVETFVRAAAATFAELGAAVVEIVLPGAAEAADIAMRMVLAEALALHRTRYEQHPELFGEDTRRRLAQGELVSGADYAASVQRMYELRQGTRRVFEKVDLVLVPTASGVAPKIQEAETVATTAHLGRFTYSLSLAAIPVMSLPCGITAKGLPVGFQIAARAWQESVLLRAATAYQSVTDWHRRRPPALHQGTSQS